MFHTVQCLVCSQPTGNVHKVDWAICSYRLGKKHLQRIGSLILVLSLNWRTSLRRKEGSSWLETTSAGLTFNFSTFAPRNSSSPRYFISRGMNCDLWIMCRSLLVIQMFPTWWLELDFFPTLRSGWRQDLPTPRRMLPPWSASKMLTSCWKKKLSKWKKFPIFYEFWHSTMCYQV